MCTLAVLVRTNTVRMHAMRVPWYTHLCKETTTVRVIPDNFVMEGNFITETILCFTIFLHISLLL